MYRVILVDDEPLVLERLRNLIDWGKIGFEIAGEAGDGEEALELFGRVSPHVVITDIRMPVINGLELSKKITKIQASVNIIILSGYSEFSYAKEAIKYGIKNYLLKPIDSADLIEALEQIKFEINKTEKLNKTVDEGNIALKDKWVFDLLNKRRSPIDIIESAKNQNIKLENKYLELIMLEIDFLEELSNEFEENSKMIEVMKELIWNNVMYGLDVLILEVRVGLYAIVCIIDEKNCEESKVRRLADSLIHKLKELMQLEVTVVLCTPTKEVEFVPEYYKRAREILDQKFLIGEDRVIHINDFEKYQAENIWNIIGDWDNQMLIGAIECNDRIAIKREIGILFDIVLERNFNREAVNLVMIDILISVNRLVKKIQGDMAQIFGARFNVRQEVNSIGAINDLKAWIEKLCFSVCTYISQSKSKRPVRISMEIIDYINSHYQENVTLKSLAKRLYMNPVYLGQLFKCEISKSFNDYLTEVRVNKAADMLSNTQFKIYEIAEKVGYKEPGNLYKAFKKMKGVSPLDYIKEMRDNL